MGTDGKVNVWNCVSQFASRGCRVCYYNREMRKLCSTRAPLYGELVYCDSE